MKIIAGLALLSLLAGCSHEAKKVDCDAYVTAINAPTPVLKTDATAKATSP
jgi:outer membrane murein-binding lipoprotein Lpp